MRKRSISKWLQQYACYVTLCVVSIVYIATFLCVEKRSFWIVDNANKFIQLEAINQSKFSDFSIPWQGKVIDPDFKYNPIPMPFSIVKNGKLYSVYPPLFAAISVFFFRLFGFPGLYVLPLLCSIVGLVGLLKIIKLMNLGNMAQAIVIIIAGLCTPLWFYSVVFWEHSITLCLSLWGIYYCLRFLNSASYRYLIIGSLISTCAIYLREELILFCLILLGTLLIIQPKQRLKILPTFLVTSIVSIIPLLIFNWVTIGSPIGFRSASNLSMSAGIAEHITTRPLVFYHLFLKSSRSMLLSLLLSIPLILLFLVRPRLKERSFSFGFTSLNIFAFTVSIYYLFSHLFSNAPINQIFHSNSLFVVSPVLILALMRYRKDEKSTVNPQFGKLIWLTAIGFSLLFALVTPVVTSWGIHWGNRILLLVYPLLAIFCVKNIEDWIRLRNRRINWQTALCVVTLLTTMSIQFYSISVLQRKKALSYRQNQVISEYKGDVVITNVDWAPQELFTVFFSKKVFFVSAEERYYQLTQKLASKGHEEVLFVTSPLEKTRKLADKIVIDRKLNCFGLFFFIENISKKMDTK